MRYDEARFRATHNSYSGNIHGKRGSIAQQLDAGVRCVELDFHDNDYERIGDYRVGHGLGPGSDVSHGGGNPPKGVLGLKQWLAVVAEWSAREKNKDHAPITLILDMWDDLTDNRKGGDPTDLNETLQAAFGASLFTRAEFDRTGQWPELGALRRRFLCVLSGNPHTRGRYRWDFGASPAIAVNQAGDVVLVFVAASGDVRCWTGRADAAGAVAWRRRNPYSDGRVGLLAPAIAIGDDGWVVAAFRFDERIPNSLWSRLGHLDGEGRINWFSSEAVATGRAPSLAIRGATVTEIHERPSGGREKVVGTIDTIKRKIEWGKARATQEPTFTVDIAAWGAHTLACSAHPTQAWLGTRFDADALLPVRLPQIAFVELRRPAELTTLLDPVFFAAPAKDKPAIAWARARTPPLVTRAFDYEDGDGTVENIPSTDLLATQAYQEYTEDAAV